MLNLERSFTRTDVADAAGDPVVLATERLEVSLRWRRAAVGASYERPTAVERAGVVAPIYDLVMIARLGAILVVTLAMILRTVRR